MLVIEAFIVCATASFLAVWYQDHATGGFAHAQNTIVGIGAVPVAAQPSSSTPPGAGFQAFISALAKAKDVNDFKEPLACDINVACPSEYIVIIYTSPFGAV